MPQAKEPINLPLLVWEALAVVLGATYTILITYGNIWCWPAALLSSIIFMYLCYRQRIYAETALHIFYFAAAIYGWATWGASTEGGYNTLPWQTHAWNIGGGFIACFALAWLLRRYTNAFWPGVDTFTTVFSIIATIMMIMAITENWYYWIIIDTVSIFLYASRRMYLTAALFIVYTLLSINGAIQWSI
ncbi:nicotinamide riboside transporter PnuC [soil metagenome]